MFQPELFQDLPTEQKPKRFQLPAFAGRFLRVKVAYEDIVFLSLAILLVVLGGFCLGVERGKRLVPPPAVLETEGLAAAGEALSPDRIQGRRPLPVIPVGASPAPSGSSLETQGSYCIQLATYIGEITAQEEVRRLAKAGVRTQLVRQGRYLELRAVGYRSRLEATGALTGLRKNYRDAFIKRLS